MLTLILVLLAAALLVIGVSAFRGLSEIDDILIVREPHSR